MTCARTQSRAAASACSLPLRRHERGLAAVGGLIALADQMAGGRVGEINKTLYKLGKGNDASSYFHDITVGDNGVPAGAPGYADRRLLYSSGLGRGDWVGFAHREHARAGHREAR